MRREEEEIRQLKANNHSGGIDQKGTLSKIPRPLHCLFNVAHAYATSLQLEMLSSQAEALRRGAWSNSVLSDELGGRNTSKMNTDNNNGGITVSPICYFENEKHFSKRWPNQSAPTSAMAIHFWSCDDRHGTPAIGDLTLTNTLNPDYNNEKSEQESMSATSSVTHTRSGVKNISNYLQSSDTRGEKRLSLCFRSVPQHGIVVSVSGGVNVMQILQSTMNMEDKDSANTSHLRRNVEKLLSSVLDPFQLSSSHALLYATVTCAHLRCVSLVKALLSQKSKTVLPNEETNMRLLPPWIHLSVDCGTISVCIQITYDYKDNGVENERESNGSNVKQSILRPPFEVFRLACDSRTGNFITLFPPETSLLRSLVCNDPSASEIQQYRSAMLSPFTQSLQKSNTSSSATSSIISKKKEFTGRIVRGIFEGLSRSLNILGRRVGVGGDWNDEKDGDQLRRRAIEKDCVDVRVSLMSCCGVAAVFGTVSRALAIVTGTDAVADL